MIVRIKYEDGTTEDHELKNGVHFADVNGEQDVPGSKLAFKLGGQQVRYLTVTPEEEGYDRQHRAGERERPDRPDRPGRDGRGLRVIVHSGARPWRPPAAFLLPRSDLTNTGGPPMNRMWLAGLLTLLLAAPPGRAQDSKPADTVPAPTNIQGAEYPRIHPDLRVTFRIKAPDAQKVVFGFFDSQRYPAKKGEDGFWTATTEPQVPGFHYYRVFIDGAEVNDPASETFYGTGKDASGIEIPEKGVDLLSPQGRAARRGPRALVLLEDDPGLAARLRLHPARLRHRSRRRAIRSCTCSTAAARTRRAGRTRGTSPSSWTT